MKKHLMSFFAVLLAVAFSSFTSAKKPVNTSRDEEPRFWYFYENGQLNGQIDDEKVMHTVAVTATGCSDDGTTIECARAYDEEQDPYETSPGIGLDRVTDLPD